MKTETLIFICPLILVGITLFYLPLITRPGIYFGATVDPSFPRSGEGRRLLRAYRWQLGLWVVAAMVPTAFFAPEHPLLGSIPPIFALLAAVSFSYWLNFREVHTHYGVSRPDVRQASLSPAAPPASFRFGFLLLPFLALILTALYLHLHWDEIPQRFPVHWGADGQPNRWATRDWHGVYGPVLMGAALDVFLLALAWMLARLSRNTVMRYVTVRGLEVLLYPLTLAFVVGGLLPVMKSSPDSMMLFAVVIMLLTIAGVVYWSYRKLSAARETDVSPEPQADAYWKAGLFYYNPGDPALFVAKRMGIGYTVNFAHKVVWLLLAGILIAAFLPVLLLK
jgi:uncharacterized membrane protein